jgi:hypothetical protein
MTEVFRLDVPLFECRPLFYASRSGSLQGVLDFVYTFLQIMLIDVAGLGALTAEDFDESLQIEYT